MRNNINGKYNKIFTIKIVININFNIYIAYLNNDYNNKY